MRYRYCLSLQARDGSLGVLCLQAVSTMPLGAGGGGSLWGMARKGVKKQSKLAAFFSKAKPAAATYALEDQQKQPDDKGKSEGDDSEKKEEEDEARAELERLRLEKHAVSAPPLVNDGSRWVAVAHPMPPAVFVADGAAAQGLGGGAGTALRFPPRTPGETAHLADRQAAAESQGAQDSSRAGRGGSSSVTRLGDLRRVAAGICRNLSRAPERCQQRRWRCCWC